MGCFNTFSYTYSLMKKEKLSKKEIIIWFIIQSLLLTGAFFIIKSNINKTQILNSKYQELISAREAEK